ncbi:MAG: AEC family transporter [Rhodobacteraceae bacterium]|nr:AEC family transporter [Paracoccaceae bacterium]
MAVFITVLQIVAPVFLLALIGFAWIKLGFEYRVQFVTRLAMTLSLPCLIFVSLMNTTLEKDALAATFWASCASYLIVTVVFYSLLKVVGLNLKTFLAPLIFGNTGNLGLPLALFAFGEAGLGYAVVILAVMMVYSFSFGVWVVSGGGSPFKVFKEPVVGATLAGVLFMYMEWQTPVPVTNTLELIGQMAIPLMLITLGVALARLSLGRVWRSLILSLIKAVVCVAIAWTVGVAFELEPIALAVLIVQVSTPVAVTSYLLAEKYGAEAEQVAGLVVVSTLLSVVTLPFVLVFLI